MLHGSRCKENLTDFMRYQIVAVNADGSKTVRSMELPVVGSMLEVSGTAFAQQGSEAIFWTRVDRRVIDC